MNSKVFSFSRDALTLIPSLAAEIGIKSKTAHFDIKRVALPKITSLEYLDCDDIVQQAKENSLELKSLDYMLRAAKYTRRKSIAGFSFGCWTKV